MKSRIRAALSIAHRLTATALLVLTAPSMAGAQSQTLAAADAFPKVNLIAGRSTVIGTEFDVTRIAVTNPEVADAVVVQPREILIDGKKPGTVSLIVWGSAARTQYNVVVEQPTTNLEQQLHTLFPGEDVTVGTNDGATILSGRVSSTNVMLRMGEIAIASMPKSQIINLLQVPGGSDSQQVMLQVRFAEVNRRALTEAGLSLFLTRQRLGASKRRGKNRRVVRGEELFKDGNGFGEFTLLHVDTSQQVKRRMVIRIHLKGVLGLLHCLVVISH